MRGLLTDALFGLRLLRREPAYAVVAVLTIALGIGATTTLFSVAYGVLLKPLPWNAPERLVRVSESRKGQEGRIRGTLTNGSYLAWREASTTVDGVGAYFIGTYSMSAALGNADPVRIQVGRFTTSMLDVLGAKPIRGRAFLPADEPSGGAEAMGRAGVVADPRVVLISYGLWQEWFGGRDDAIGSVVRIDEIPATVIGVMPRGFAFPDPEARAWLPMPIGGVLGANGVRRMMIFGAIARLKNGVSLAQAAAEATSRARSAPDPGLAAVSMFGSSEPPDITLTPIVEAMTADIRPAILLLFAAVGLLLVTATANVGSLQLARATTRRREFAVRAAIGAGRARLARQMILETAVIGLAGGLGSVALTWALLRSLPSLLPADFPRVADIGIQIPVVAFGTLLALATTVTCGVLPAIDSSRVDVAGALSEESTAAAWGLRGSRSARLRTAVMVGQVAVACVLLVGASLLIRSFVALIRADRGYDPTHLLTARADMPRRYEGPGIAAFADAVTARLSAEPGVVRAAAGNALPFVTGGGNWAFQTPSPRDPSITVQVQTLTRFVSPGYLSAMRLRLTDGRLLEESDAPLTRPVVVVNRSFASQYLGDRPLGRTVPMPFGDMRVNAEVVGVVEDMRQAAVTDRPAAEVFASYRQAPLRLRFGPVMFVVRTAGDALAQVNALRAAVREQDPAVVLDSIMTMDERVATSLAKPRLYALLLGGFAGAALAIAGVGLLGVLSYGVAQRRREIGVRTALGAQLGDVVGLVAREGLAIAASGVFLGFLASVVLVRYTESLLYGVARFDFVSYLSVGTAVIAVAALACVMPALRAARVNPIDALRP